jgi:hypothetical protein
MRGPYVFFSGTCSPLSGVTKPLINSMAAQHQEKERRTRINRVLGHAFLCCLCQHTCPRTMPCSADAVCSTG